MVVAACSCIAHQITVPIIRHIIGQDLSTTNQQFAYKYVSSGDSSLQTCFDTTLLSVPE